MKVVYVIFSVVGWAWLGVVGLYMVWRVYRERLEGVPGFPVNTAAEDGRPPTAQDQASGVGGWPSGGRRSRDAAADFGKTRRTMSQKHEEQC